SRRSSKVSKMTGNNDDILVDTSSRDQSSPPKNSSYNPFRDPSESDLKWAELMYKIHDDTEFITNYENAVSSEERIKMLTYLANNNTLQKFPTSFQRTYDDSDNDEGSVFNVSVRSDEAVQNYSGITWNNPLEYVREFHKNDYEYEKNQEYINEPFKNDEFIEYWHIFQGNDTPCLI
ncbi:12768_t:CDS:2, partial [Funneliformis geosporum]